MAPVQRRRASGAAAAPSPRPLEPSPRDRAYWLAHCDGFHVDSSAGRIGVVAEVRRQVNAPDQLVVRAGQRGRRHLVFDAADVAAVVPHAERVRLREGAKPLSTEVARDGADAASIEGRSSRQGEAAGGPAGRPSPG